MFSVYLRRHADGARSDQTRTGDPAAALTAFRALLDRRDLDGEGVGAVLRDQLAARTRLFSRFDTPDQQLLATDPIDLDRLDWIDADVDTRALVAARPVDGDSWAALLRRYRKRRHLSQSAAAEALGVPRSTLIGWEAGKPAGNAGLVGSALLRELDWD